MLRKPALNLAPCTIAILLAYAALTEALPAHAQPDADDKTAQRAEKIVTQPARDVGAAKETIPPILLMAIERPYRPPRGRCPAIETELTLLNDALGPDFDKPGRHGDDKLTRLAEAGGEMVVNSLIPFRGIVREVSGAAAADRRRRAAVNAGLARRGFLRGLARARNCR